jgi:hypothetical protein
MQNRRYLPQHNKRKGMEIWFEFEKNYMVSVVIRKSHEKWIPTHKWVK